jgi:hypothetical protein
VRTENKIAMYDPVWTSVVPLTNVRLSTAQSTLMRQGVILLVTMMMNGNENRKPNMKCMNGVQWKEKGRWRGSRRKRRKDEERGGSGMGRGSGNEEEGGERKEGRGKNKDEEEKRRCRKEDKRERKRMDDPWMELERRGWGSIGA